MDIQDQTKLIAPSGHEDEKTPSPKIEKTTVKESGSSGTGGIYEKSNKFEEDMFSDAVTEFSDTGVSPGVEQRPKDAIKLSDSSIEVKKVDDDSEVSETPDADTKVADKTEENIADTLHHSADTQVKLPDSDTKPEVLLVEDKDGSHKDKFTDFVDPSNYVQTKPDSFEVTDKKDNKGEEAVYVLSVPSDIPLVDHAETLINDFKDHKTVYSNSGKGAKITSMVDSFDVETAEVNIQENEPSEIGKSVLSKPIDTDFSASNPTVVFEEANGAETQPLEMSKSVLQFTDNFSEAEVSQDKDCVVTHGEKIGIEANKQNIAESVFADSKDGNKLGMPESSEKLILEKAEESRDASGVVSEALVDESEGKLLTGQEFCVDASVDSSSRNSLEGNWGSVSVLSTKSDAFEGSTLVEPKKNINDQEVSEIKAGTVQNSRPTESEANDEGRKRNKEAIAKVTNWSTTENTNALKNLVSEPKSSNPKQLSTMIEKDEAAEKMSEPGKSNLVNQETSPPKYINEGKKVRKKGKGIASWVPFGCCSSVNVN